jgi:hypothetical protein
MRAPIIGLVCALVALAPLIWRPDLPLLYVTVFMGRLPSQRCSSPEPMRPRTRARLFYDASPETKRR